MEVLSKSLKAHGEAFMQMFDSEPDEQAAKPSAAPHLAGNLDDDPVLGDDATSSDARDSDCEATHMAAAPLEFAFDGKQLSQWRAAAGKHRSAKPGGIGETAVARQERRCFMSAKASKVHQTAAATVKQGKSSGDDEFISRDDFKRMQRDVVLYGASALDKKQRKAFDDRLLRQSNATLEKQSRTPASIGRGMARKQVEREHKALEAAIDAGMISRCLNGAPSECQRRRPVGFASVAGNMAKAGRGRQNATMVGGKGKPGTKPVNTRKGRKAQKLPNKDRSPRKAPSNKQLSALIVRGKSMKVSKPPVVRKPTAKALQDLPKQQAPQLPSAVDVEPAVGTRQETWTAWMPSPLVHMWRHWSRRN
ncbi:hypothetical protein WJX72_001422 [[Myrmecia] bisecta]|uniref:Uncharacterized protein n=1 Tax=[Myrmecia] bisecta TaxID=41462 RepID=A0AAW1PVL7_9CHLO